MPEEDLVIWVHRCYLGFYQADDLFNLCSTHTPTEVGLKVDHAVLAHNDDQALAGLCLLVPNGRVESSPAASVTGSSSVAIEDHAHRAALALGINHHGAVDAGDSRQSCLLYTSPSPRDRQKSRM